MIGRNDLCPCGSGKKYKKCCLQKNQRIEFSKNKVIYAKGLYRNLENKIVEYSNQIQYSEEKDNCKKKFYIFNETNDKVEQLFKTYFVHDYIMENQKVIANMYVRDNKNNLNKSQSDILIGMFDSYISLFKVKKIDATKVLVKDCIINNDIQIEDIEIFKDLKEGDLIIGRCINIQGMNIFVDTTVKVSHKNEKIIVENIKDLYNKYKEKTINNLKEFIIYHSDLIYKFAQQILLTDEYFIVKRLSLDTERDDYKEEKNNKLDIYDILKTNIEEKYLQRGLDLWKDFVKAKKSITGNENGWAAAVEYYIKKDAGESITQVQISQKYEVSTSTLGKRYKELRAS